MMKQGPEQKKIAPDLLDTPINSLGEASPSQPAPIFMRETLDSAAEVYELFSKSTLTPPGSPIKTIARLHLPDGLTTFLETMLKNEERVMSRARKNQINNTENEPELWIRAFMRPQSSIVFKIVGYIRNVYKPCVDQEAGTFHVSETLHLERKTNKFIKKKGHYENAANTHLAGIKLYLKVLKHIKNVEENLKEPKNLDTVINGQGTAMLLSNELQTPKKYLQSLKQACILIRLHLYLVNDQLEKDTEMKKYFSETKPEMSIDIETEMKIIMLQTEDEAERAAFLTEIYPEIKNLEKSYASIWERFARLNLDQRAKQVQKTYIKSVSFRNLMLTQRGETSDDEEKSNSLLLCILKQNASLIKQGKEKSRTNKMCDKNQLAAQNLGKQSLSRR